MAAYDDTLYCPLNYRPCKWSDTDEVQCIPSEHMPCTDTKKEYREWYEDGKTYPCLSPAQWNDHEDFEAGLSCKFVEEEKKFAYQTDKPVLSRQRSERAERPGWIIPRFTIDAHGKIKQGTTTIPPNMSLTTWGAWGFFQWNLINDRIFKLLSKRERLTNEDIKKVYQYENLTQVAKPYQCTMNTFPPTWKKDEYKLGAEGNRVIPYNQDCYEIRVSSHGRGGGGKKDQVQIQDTTMNRQWSVLPADENTSKEKLIWKDGETSKGEDGTIIWKNKPITEVLKLIYKYSNEKYGPYGTAYKWDRNNQTSAHFFKPRLVGRIRVDLLCCLRYDVNCNYGSDSKEATWKKKTIKDFDEEDSTTFDQIQQHLKKRETKVLYSWTGGLDPVENMEHWRFGDVVAYDGYFKNLENWISTEKDKKNLEKIYGILSQQIYKSLFFAALPESPSDDIKTTTDTRFKLFQVMLGNFKIILEDTVREIIHRDKNQTKTENFLTSACQFIGGMQDSQHPGFYSACQEYILMIFIAVKFLKLGGNVNALIKIEKSCLISWMFFLHKDQTLAKLPITSALTSRSVFNLDGENNQLKFYSALISSKDSYHNNYYSAQNVGELLPPEAIKLVPPPLQERPEDEKLTLEEKEMKENNLKLWNNITNDLNITTNATDKFEYFCNRDEIKWPCEITHLLSLYDTFINKMIPSFLQRFKRVPTVMGVFLHPFWPDD